MEGKQRKRLCRFQSCKSFRCVDAFITGELDSASSLRTPIYTNAGTYKYTLEFAIPSCGCSHVQLTGSFAADNSAQAYLDGVAIPGASCAGPACFKSPQAPVSLNGAPSLSAGMHTLEIDVTNNPPYASYSGLIVNARLTRTCP